jgi:uncharacterized membrane protein YdbT with pleckstrin-like domain
MPNSSSMPKRHSDAPDDSAEQTIFEIGPAANAYLGSILLGIPLVFLFVGVFILLGVWYKVASRRYRLTNQRLFVQHGIVAKHLEEIELFRVKDVTVRQGFLQRILGCGTVTVLSTDDTTPVLQIAGIARPVEIKEAIRNAFRAARKREGMRTGEFIPS